MWLMAPSLHLVVTNLELSLLCSPVRTIPYHRTVPSLLTLMKYAVKNQPTSHSRPKMLLETVHATTSLASTTSTTSLSFQFASNYKHWKANVAATIRTVPHHSCSISWITWDSRTITPSYILTRTLHLSSSNNVRTTSKDSMWHRANSCQHSIIHSVSWTRAMLLFLLHHSHLVLWFQLTKLILLPPLFQLVDNEMIVYFVEFLIFEVEYS